MISRGGQRNSFSFTSNGRHSSKLMSVRTTLWAAYKPRGKAYTYVNSVTAGIKGMLTIVLIKGPLQKVVLLQRRCRWSCLLFWCHVIGSKAQKANEPMHELSEQIHFSQQYACRACQRTLQQCVVYRDITQVCALERMWQRWRPYWS